MPRPKAKRAARPPETDDEFLDSGVALEEAAEKWRAGDSEKAARFYTRALQTYEQGLGLYPSSFDLLYNKARVQFSITQLPNVRAHFAASTKDLLQTALQSHRLALTLEPSNADLLFNTGQVLTCLAEVSNDGDTLTSLMLEEALTLFEKCLSRQQVLLQEQQAQSYNFTDSPEDAEDEQGGVPIDEERIDSPWARVVQPMTQASLLETAVAMLETFSALCNSLSDATALVQVEERSARILNEVIPLCLNAIDDENIKDEVTCASAKFRASFSEAQYRHRIITYAQFSGRLQSIFELDSANVLETRSYSFLVCCSDALISFATAGSDEVGAGVLTYKRLTTALAYLAKASTLSDASKDLPLLHMSRGDAEMLRFSICSFSHVPENLRSPGALRTLLQNALTFYRGANATAKAASSIAEEISTSLATKQAVVESIVAGNNEALQQLISSGLSKEGIYRVITSMVEESLVQEETLTQSQIL